MIIRETAEAYHEREAASAGFAWDIVKPGGCPAQAWHDSVFNPDWREIRARRGSETTLSVGTAAHLAVLEGHEFAARCSLVPYPDWRTNASREIRAQCVIDGRVPLLPKDYELVQAMHHAIRHSDAAEYFFGEGESEVGYTWRIPGLPGSDRLGLGVTAVDCKARADRIVPGAIVDLKTAVSASPEAFQRAMVRDGHHLRAAWYLDGWAEQHREHAHDGSIECDYLYVVVAKIEPHLVSIFKIDDVNTVFEPGFEQYDRVSALEWGRMLCRKALSEIRRARETGVWSGYSREGEKINTVSLPAFAEHQLADMEANDEL
jgi:hypothetical protein